MEERTPEEKFYYLVDRMREGLALKPERIRMLRFLLAAPERLIPDLQELAMLINNMTPQERMVFREAIDAALKSSSSGAEPPTSTAAESSATTRR